MIQAQTAPATIDPSWMTVRAADSTVEVRLTAGLTPANGGMNFNGGFKGALTLTVPLKWHVVLHFTNDDDNMPHSAEVIRDQGLVPATLPSTPAFPGAATRDMSLGANDGSKEDVRFNAEQAGSYFIVCAVPGHGAAGMWIRLVVSTSATKPGITQP